jgi:WD40 repeat protein
MKKMKITMKKILYSIFITLLITLTWTTNSHAQKHTRFGLPEGAKVRLGKGSIENIAYSPNGKLLAVASSIGVWIYDAQTGEELDLYTGHTKLVICVAFSPDSQTLASGSRDDTIRLWDVNTGNHLHTLTGHVETSWASSVAFSPDSQTLASASGDYTIRLWDVNTGNHIRTFTGHTDGVNSVAFSPDGADTHKCE